MADTQHTCVQLEKLSELEKAVIKLTLIQEQHAEYFRESAAERKALLETLATERIDNAKFKSKVGGIVIATATGVSIVWGLILGAIQLVKVLKS